MRKLTKMLQFDLIHVETKACINYGNKIFTCHTCKDICPTDAITLHDNLPEVKQSKCINCGACVSECPVLAIDHLQKPYKTVINELQKMNHTIVTCEQYEEIQHGIKIPCYRYMDVPMLLLLGKKEETVCFDTTKCATCSKADYFTITEHMDRLHESLRILNISIELKQDKVPLRELDDECVSGISRRDLFKRLSLKNIRSWVLDEDENEEPFIDSSNLNKMERQLFKRKLLNGTMKERVCNIEQVSQSEAYLPFPDFLSIQMTDSCNGCNLCTQICPTNALHWENNANGKDSRLVFSIENCIACQKCTACPEQSIILERLSLQDYLQLKNKKLKEFHMNTCKSCHEIFRAEGEKELCPFCEENSKKDPLRFFA